MPTLVDLHCHTSRHSTCSVLPPQDAVRLALEAGLDGLVLTEHDYLWSPDALAELHRDVSAPARFLLLAGQEVETDVGHVLVYGAPRSLPGPWSLATLRQEHPRAALVWAHPFRYHRRPDDQALLSPLVNAIEVLNANQTPEENQAAVDAYYRLGFTAVAGSDSHEPDKAARFPTVLDDPVCDVAELVAALHQGRCRPFLPVHRSDAKP